MGTLGKTRAQTLLAICIAISSITTESNAAGRSTSAAVNTILNGKGAPKSSLGIDGDFYIDTRSLLIYGPKSKGRWPVPVSLQGPTGPAGSVGKSGVDGKSISNVGAITGAQGAVGPQGEKGEKGEKGEQGATGAVGPQGPSGASGSNGAQGAQGVAGAQGATGATGAIGPQGAQGVAGPQGVAGVTGAVGAQGAKGETGTSVATEVFVTSIPTWILSTGSRYSYSTSSKFGNLLPNHSYQYWIHIEGTSEFPDLTLGLYVLGTNSTVQYSYSRNDFTYATYSDFVSVYSFDIVGTAITTESEGWLEIRVLDAFADTNSNPLTLSGKAYITSVGAIR